MFIPYTEM